METLIEEGRKGLGKFILPFKESKIQLLNTRLASLKSTLQYASSVNVDPSISQLSLSGAWVMSQFKILIDEREEAKRNFEQLKAEIGSINSGLGEPSNGPSNAQPKPSAANVAETSEIQFASTPAYEVELAAYNGQVPSCLPDQILPADSASEIKAADEPNPKPASINQFTGEPQDSSTGKRLLTDVLRSVPILLCCPYEFFFSRGAFSSDMVIHYDLQPALSFYQPAPYPYGPVDTAYGNLETYGPEGVFELAVPASGGPAPLSLPAPAELESYYHS